MAITKQQASGYVALMERLRPTIPGNILPWVTAQVWHESNGGTSNVAKQNLNYSGIVWINKPYQVATRGTARPKSEGGYYAKYKTLADWSRDFMRILALSPGRPVDASSLMDYVARLKKNGYFAVSEASYYQALKKIIDQYTAPAAAASNAREEQRVKNAYSVADHYKSEAQRLADKANFNILDPKTYTPVAWLGLGLAAVLILRR